VEDRRPVAAHDQGLTPEGSIADLLSCLPFSGADDFAMRVLDLYQRAMQVFQPSEQAYQATVRANQAGNGFSVTTNY